MLSSRCVASAFELDAATRVGSLEPDHVPLHRAALGLCRALTTSGFESASSTTAGPLIRHLSVLMGRTALGLSLGASYAARATAGMVCRSRLFTGIPVAMRLGN
jgi:hypothetical protein